MTHPRKGERVRKEDFPIETEVETDIAVLKRDVLYLEKVVDILNKDIGIAHTKIRADRKVMLGILLGFISGVAYVAREILLMLARHVAGQ